MSVRTQDGPTIRARGTREGARAVRYRRRRRGTAITRVFDLEVARTGFTEGEARTKGLDCVATTLDSRNHAGYMPDAKPLTIKLVAERGTGRLLGAQAVGRGGADKRIDVVATALHAGLTVEDLTRLDLEYVPPFNGVWDPVQVAATALLRQGLYSVVGEGE